MIRASSPIHTMGSGFIYFIIVLHFASDQGQCAFVMHFKRLKCMIHAF